MITVYYGKDGSMTKVLETEAEAIAEINKWYSSDEFKGCCVTEIRDGEWVIAYILKQQRPTGHLMGIELEAT